MTPREEAERWFTEARENLASAHDLFKKRRYGLCAFHCQQTAEIGLKAVLYSVGDRPYGHSLKIFLADIAERKQIRTDPFLEEIAEALDDYYISGRYPDAYKDTIPSKHFTEEKASEALEWAELFLQFAMTNLN